jgi:hypothetical protein
LSHSTLFFLKYLTNAKILSIYCDWGVNMYVIDIALYLINFLFCMLVQHFQYMFKNFTIYMPKLIKLLILSLPP